MDLYGGSDSAISSISENIGSEIGMTIPTVSVVVPTYNRAASLGRLLRCIARQSYQHFECLVIDDGSNDQTQAQYEAIWQGLDTRFRLYLKSKDDRRFGPARSRNRGIELAQGAFIAFCDDDDLWIRDDHLATAVRLLTQYQADFFFANMQSSADGVTVNPRSLFAIRHHIAPQSITGGGRRF